MANVKKSAAKKQTLGKVSMLDAAIIGASTPTMGKLETESVTGKKITKSKKTKKVSMFDAAIMGASTPTMGKPGTKR